MLERGVWTCALIVLASSAAGADTLHPRRAPARLTPQLISQVQHQERHQSLNHLSTATKGLIAMGQHDTPARLPSIPTWSGSFQSEGATYPAFALRPHDRIGEHADHEPVGCEVVPAIDPAGQTQTRTGRT